MGRAAPSGDLVIERARLSGKGGRDALEAALGHVVTGDVAEGEEILLIPRLRARAPLSSRRSPGDFGARLTDQLRALRAAAAVDPAGPVPGAAALRFTSKARYAAWLIALWLEGPRGRQAAPSILAPPFGEIRGWLAREVLCDGPVFVATTARLVPRRLAAAWLARLGPSEVSMARASVERAYGVLPASPEPPAPGIAASGRADARHPRNGAREPELRPTNGKPSVHPLPIETWAELCDADPLAPTLAAAPARLLLLAVALARAPSAGRDLAPAMLDRALSGPPEPERRIAALQPISKPQPVVAGPPARTPSDTPGFAKSRTLAGRAEPAPSRRARPIPVSAPEASAEASPRTQAASRPDPRPPADIAPESPPLPSTAALDTDFGGVFFLVNALLALGLYPDFTRPLGKSLGPSPFWLLDRLALRMFGGQYRRDPLHRWLAAIGVERPLPPRWEVEPRWLAGLPLATHGFRRSRTRTILWDLRGFALLDGPRGLCRAGRAVARRYRRCGPLANRLPALPRRTMPRDPGGRWIACLAEFLCARLALAGEGLGPQALRLAARVVVDEERVDLRFDLARLPIELRLAGLDRDPGWLPAEGRSLSFHFE